MKIALIVEGPSDKRFFEKLYEQFYRHTQFEVFVRPAGGKPRIFNKAQHHFHSCIYGEGADHVIFIVDIDQSTEVNTLAKFKINGDPSKYSVHVVIRELEAWFLADGNCLSKVLDTLYQPSGYTDKIENPKEKLQMMFKKKFGYILTEMEMVDKIIEHFSLDSASQYNNSARKFKDKLSEFLLQGSPA